MGRMLGREHEVVTAGSGAEAQAILEKDSSFDVVLCDLMMPQMTGMDLHEWLAKRTPVLAARTIFMTGGVFTPRAAEFLAKVSNLKLEKPCAPKTLVGIVSKMVVAARNPT